MSTHIETMNIVCRNYIGNNETNEKISIRAERK